MDKKLFRSLLLLITFTVVLTFCVVRFDDVWGIASSLMGLLTPLFAGLALAFVLHGPCQFFRRQLNKTKAAPLSLPLAVTLSYLMLLAILVALFSFLIPQLVASISLFASNLDGYIAQSQAWINQLSSIFRLIDFSQISSLIENMVNATLNTIGTALPQLLSLTSTVISVIFTIVLSLVFSIYMLAGADTLTAQTNRFLKAYLPHKVYLATIDVWSLTANTFRKFVVGQVTDACILGCLTCLSCLLFGFDYALLIGTLVAVTALVPIVGAYVGGGTSALLLAMISPLQALAFVVMLICLQQLEGNLIYPRIVGSSLGLPGLWVLASVTVGGGLFGLPGMLLSVPVAAILYTLLKRDVRKRLTK